MLQENQPQHFDARPIQQGLYTLCEPGSSLSHVLASPCTDIAQSSDGDSGLYSGFGEYSHASEAVALIEDTSLSYQLLDYSQYPVF